MTRETVLIDGNTAAAYVAHATNEVIAIYPITPSSPMGELADQYSADGKPNLWGTIPTVTEMQSEAGAAGAVHGALTAGALVTTFTASQGLLLMIPNMLKIAGELTPTVFHIAARALATHALSIFGDHTDVMATRSTGFGMLSSNNVQEVMDMALIAQAATLESRIPFLHFFDGFRTSHEVQKVQQFSFDDMRAVIDDNTVIAHRARAMNPERPVLKGTSQNPDVFFAARETVNKYYDAAPAIVQKVMDRFAKVVGRKYRLFDYVGAPDAERVAVMMGSGADAMEEVVEHLVAKGEKVGLVKCRLYRPFSVDGLVAAVPRTVKAIAVLDRTKEPGSLGEPLYHDVRTGLGEAMQDGRFKAAHYPRIVGGRYGLGSAEFNPGMAKAVLDNLKAAEPKNHFTIGIDDDVTHSSLPYDESVETTPAGTHSALFYGLGSDGTVSANKNSIKIIGDATENYAQGYFVYDSKKAGTYTISHLRFGKKPIKSTYLVQHADFVACHQFNFLEKIDMLAALKPGGTFLLASPYGKDEVWDRMPAEVQKQIIDKKVKFYIIDASGIAEKAGMGRRINVTMQTAFFKVSGVLPEAEAVELIKKAVEKTYGRKGQEVVERNIATIDMALAGVEAVQVPQKVSSKRHMMPPVSASAPPFVKEVIGPMVALRGDKLPVSKLPDDGTFPTGTTRYEKRNVAEYIPVWDPETCIQCGECSMVCPHGTIRLKIFDPKLLAKAPASFKSADARGRQYEGMKAALQVAPEDCTGCEVCVNVCPAFQKVDGQKTERKAINMEPQPPLREQEAKNWDFFLSIPNLDRSLIQEATIKGSQLLEPMFEFSGACAGCGETPYVKLVTQLFGDRATIANATGCSSIYGGNLPTTPYTHRADGRGPTWSNSLFEDAAEFGMGMRLTADKLREFARELLDRNAKAIGETLVKEIKENPQLTPGEIEFQRQKVGDLKAKIAKIDTPEAKQLLAAADYLIKRSVWIFGGDGWAYDIGYGGLDHVLASGKNVNVLCLDTEMYSNTGGQMSKATPIGSIAKFAAGGKPIVKKDLGMMAMSYGYVYVARVAMGANKLQTIRALVEAESYDGPSLVIAYAHCINHGIDMAHGMDQQKGVVESGLWTLFRYDPRMREQGKNPLTFDSREPKIDPKDYMYKEIRFRALTQYKPEAAEEYLQGARDYVKQRFALYRTLAGGGTDGGKAAE
jgi:pyruvate-ferredoxin/flavodoxin oxidoreductase